MKYKAKRNLTIMNEKGSAYSIFKGDLWIYHKEVKDVIYLVADVAKGRVDTIGIERKYLVNNFEVAE